VSDKIAQRPPPGPPDAAQTHGVYSWLDSDQALSCRRCIERNDCEHYEPEGRCVLQQRFYSETLEAVLEQDGIDRANPVHRMLAERFAFWWTLSKIAERWLGQVGYFRVRSKALDAQPVVKTLATATTHLRGLATELGLTPAAAARLKQERSERSVTLRYADD